MVELLTLFAAEEAAEKTGIAVLGINPLALVLQLVTFLILFLLLKKFAFGPIVSMLDERHRKINQGLELTHQLEAEKQKLDEEASKILHATRQEADKILTDAHQEAGSIVKQAEERAASKAETMQRDAEARLAQDIESARQGLETEMADLVAEATEKILGEKMDSQKDQSLIKQALSGVRRT